MRKKIWVISQLLRNGLLICVTCPEPVYIPVVIKNEYKLNFTSICRCMANKIWLLPMVVIDMLKCILFTKGALFLQTKCATRASTWISRVTSSARNALPGAIRLAEAKDLKTGKTCRVASQRAMSIPGASSRKSWETIQRRRKIRPMTSYVMRKFL